MTYSNANDIIDSFLSTMDSFGITSDEEEHINFVDTVVLLDWWYNEKLGVIEDDERR